MLLRVVCRDGNVSLQEYMAFMISRETENVKSSEEIESAFRALSTENKPYVTKEELHQVRGGAAAHPLLWAVIQCALEEEEEEVFILSTLGEMSVVTATVQCNRREMT